MCVSGTVFSFRYIIVQVFYASLYTYTVNIYTNVSLVCCDKFLRLIFFATYMIKELVEIPPSKIKNSRPFLQADLFEENFFAGGSGAKNRERSAGLGRRKKLSKSRVTAIT